ncbi:conserved hypothetical protein [delta proteobacterium NaphS2]|nr:conserved hypothetical protein [delta proteobacterium NaphS2]
MKNAAKALLFLAPIILWLGCSLVVLAPDLFNQSRMADMAVFWFFGIFTNPIELFSILGDFDHPAIQAILVFLLLLPLAIWVVWPLVFRAGLTTRSFVYLVLLFVYMLPGAFLSGARYRSATRANNFGAMYPDLRYAHYDRVDALSEEEINQTISFAAVFEDSPKRVMNRYTVTVSGGSVYPVDEEEYRFDWGLRKLLQAPTNGYLPSFEFDKLRSRRPSKRYFYFKVGERFGKGVVYGHNHARLFFNTSSLPTFGAVKKQPSLSDWVSWYFKADETVYMK